MERAVKQLNIDADRLREEGFTAEVVAVQRAADALEKARRAVEVSGGEEDVAKAISTTGVAARTLRRMTEVLGEDAVRKNVRNALAQSLRAMFRDTIPIDLDVVWDPQDPDNA